MKTLRWQQRFENFEKAFIKLSTVLSEKKASDYSLLEQEGIVQRFEYTFELAWKTLKDHLEYTGIQLTEITPRNVIKQAFSTKLIKDGELWIEMLEHRNIMSHQYNEQLFAKIINAIFERYFVGIQQVYSTLKSK